MILFYVNNDLHYYNIIDLKKLPENQIVCNRLLTCSKIDYEVTDTYHFDDWNFLKLTNLVKNNCIMVTK